MKYWAVTHRHTTFIAAETEAGAKEDCAQQVRDNAGADECTAVEISEGEYGRHRETQGNRSAVRRGETDGGLNRMRYKIKWECFCDESYFGMWAVRPVGETRWGYCFHVQTTKEALGLRDLLNELQEAADKARESAKED